MAEAIMKQPTIWQIHTDECERKLEMDKFDSPLFRQNCHNCGFCSGLRDEKIIEDKGINKAPISARGSYYAKNVANWWCMNLFFSYVVRRSF